MIELMVVVAIIGILTAMIIPEMTGTYQDALLRSTSRDLIDVVEVTHSHAVGLNQVRRVCLDEKNGRYLVEKRIIMEGQENFVPVDDAGGSGELNSKIKMEFHQPDEASAPDDDAASGTVPAAQMPSPGRRDGRDGREGDFTSTISFYPDGTADPGVIELADRDGFRLGLKINPITARVQVEELARK